MQPCDLCLAAVVQKYDYARGVRMHRSVIRGRNGILVPITRPNAERLKWSGVKQFSNSRDHKRELIRILFTPQRECVVASAISDICHASQATPIRLRSGQAHSAATVSRISASERTAFLVV